MAKRTGPKRSQRAIEHLRRQFPHLQWTYEYPSIWKASNGWEIQAYATMGWTDDDWGSIYYLQRSTRVEDWNRTKDKSVMVQYAVGGFPSYIAVMGVRTGEVNPLDPPR